MVFSILVFFFNLTTLSKKFISAYNDNSDLELSFVER